MKRAVLGLVCLVVGCGEGPPIDFTSGGGGAGGEGGAGGATTATSTGGAGGQGGIATTTAEGGGGAGGEGGAGGSAGCVTPPDVDNDGDGTSEDQGDCDDCNAAANPGALELPGNGIDDDCDGTADNAVESCDESVFQDSADPEDAVRALDICKMATTPSEWGVLDVKYTRALDGIFPPPKPLQWGLSPSFGTIQPRAGKRMLALSNGHARDANDLGACGATTCANNYNGTPPLGFPQDVPGCDLADDIHDDVALHVTMRAPTNAKGYAFDFRFFSFEFPEWVCTSYNDQFIALVNPAPPGSINGNVAFDAAANPVSVNLGFFDVCDPASADQWALNCASGACPPLPDPYCAAGNGELMGTGFKEWDTFGYAGGTGWLKTTAPVEPGGEVTIRFTIWDSGDDALDSTVLIDNFQWLGASPAVATAKD